MSTDRVRATVGELTQRDAYSSARSRSLRVQFRMVQRGCLDRRVDGKEAADLKIGISHSLLTSDWDWAIHGLRHDPEAGTSGWYCWTVDLSGDADFFVQLHQR